MSGYHFPAVFVRCKRGPATRTVIHCHANACDVGHIYELCQRDAECWRANILLVEYPGYGASPGVAYERSVDRHVMVAYSYLTEELRLGPESIVLFGRSLGSGPVCRLASKLQEMGEKVGGVILHSPFISVREVGVALLGGVANVMGDRWDNRKPLSSLKSRMLIIHGASDEVVPFTHAETLRDIRVNNKLHCTFFPTQGTHNYFSYYRDYLHPVENFLSAHKGRVLPALPDPLPRAKYSKAQVREIMELRKTNSEAERAAEAEDDTDEHVNASDRSRRDRAAVRDVANLLGRSGGTGGARVTPLTTRRDGSPNSTLVDGSGNEYSGPTSSDDEDDQGSMGTNRKHRHTRNSLDLGSGNAGSTPGPRKVQWRKGQGRTESKFGGAVVRTSFDKKSEYDDGEEATRIPGGASPFGSKKVSMR
tara:strand:- start:1064 stop:2326 length:1263 start_codon:yes stop_codon:yes gene_type:complete